MELVGEAGDGEDAVAQAAALQPDLVLMDIQMPGLNGIEATRRLMAASPHVRVLVVTMFEDDASVFAAMRAGARGYLLKGARYDEVLRAIRAVGSGEAIFSPAVTLKVFPELSDRERQILDLLARGMKNADIADRLYLSPKTVRNHVSIILGKLQVADRAEAAARARAAGLG